jgi:hypothetical protein
MVASYNFDGNPNDTSGNNNHLTSINNVAYSTSDFRLGTRAALFNGSNYFEINNDGRFSPDDFTVACWVKPVDSAGNVQSIATCRNGNSLRGWMIYIGPNNTLEFITGSGASAWSGPASYGSDGLLNVIGNTWVHLAFSISKSASSVLVYVNGTHTRTIARMYANNTDKPLRIGAGGEFPGELCVKSGTLMDDFRFYNRVLSAAEIASVISSSFLIASYNFENNPNDSSGKGNTLSSINNVAYSASDYKLGTRAASFSGSNYFEIANDGRFSPNDFTVAFWIKPVSSTTDYQSIATCRNGNSLTGWMIYISPNNDLEFVTGTGTSFHGWVSSIVYNVIANSWVHLAFCITKKPIESICSCQVYVNGSLNTTITGRPYANNTDKPLRIGAGGDSAGGELFLKPGTIMDDFRFYNKVLLAAEISTIYTQA